VGLKYGLNDVCKMITDVVIQDACIATVQQFTPVITGFIQNLIGQNVCENPCEKKFAVTVDDPTWNCEVCQQGMQLVEDLISTPVILSLIKVELAQVCQMIPSPALVASCTATIEQFFPTLFAFFTTELRMVCSMVVKPGCPITKSSHLQVKANNADMCEAVKLMQEQLPAWVAQSEPVCNQIPNVTLASSCHVAFQKDQPQINEGVKKLFHTLFPEIFFPCLSNSESAKAPFVQAPDPTKCPATTTCATQNTACPQCIICWIGVMNLQNIVNTPIVFDGIRDSLKDQCDKLNATLPAMVNPCKASINQFIPEIISFISEVLLPRICTTPATLNCPRCPVKK